MHKEMSAKLFTLIVETSFGGLLFAILACSTASGITISQVQNCNISLYF